jgi:hypothetical protein
VQGQSTKTSMMERNSGPENEFTLIPSGVAALTDEYENRFFEAGCHDGTLSSRYGVVHAIPEVPPEASRSHRTAV